MIRAADCIERYRVGTAAPRDPGANGAGVSAIEAALRSSRVDLLERVRDGLPPREFIPGMGGALVRGKRHHIHGPAKTGKTETIAVVGGLDIAAAGCTVVVLDRENGADEYARRVAAVLNAGRPARTSNPRPVRTSRRSSATGVSTRLRTRT
jgi:hypothetical protein